MTWDALRREVADDFVAARETRSPIADRKVHDYQLYRNFSEDVANRGGGERGWELAATGPFGWSKLSVPLVYWTIETILPRIATNPPVPVVKARNPAAVPYAQGRQMRLNAAIEKMEMMGEIVRCLKSMLALGDGIGKVSWNADAMNPRFTAIPWWDWFLSSEARDPYDAEVQFHRTWYTKRQLIRLSRVVDRDGKPLFRNLDKLVEADDNESVIDDELDDRREASGYGTPDHAEHGGLYALVECWYQDGTVVVISGREGDLIHQVRSSPFRDERQRPIRPFVVFRNTPDIDLPYGIGDAEMLENHQVELTTLRRQAIDQGTYNLSAPVVASRSAGVTSQEIDAAFGQPGGKLLVNGDVDRAVKRIPAGQLSGDFERFYDNIRGEAQVTTGVNDNQAGQVSDQGQTATEIRIINAEANKRWQMKVKFVEEAMGKVAKLIDLALYRYGPVYDAVPLEEGFKLDPRSRGITGLDGRPFADSVATPGSFVRVAAPEPTAEFNVSIKAGSLSLPSEDEHFLRIAQLAQVLAPIDGAAQVVDWTKVVEQLTQAAGYDPDEILKSSEQLQMEQLAAQLAQQGPPGGELPPGGGATLPPEQAALPATTA